MTVHIHLVKPCFQPEVQIPTFSHDAQKLDFKNELPEYWRHLKAFCYLHLMHIECDNHEVQAQKLQNCLQIYCGAGPDNQLSNHIPVLQGQTRI